MDKPMLIEVQKKAVDFYLTQQHTQQKASGYKLRTFGVLRVVDWPTRQVYIDCNHHLGTLDGEIASIFRNSQGLFSFKDPSILPRGTTA